LNVLCTIYLVQGMVALAASHLALARRRKLEGMRVNFALIRSMYPESAPFFVSRVGLWLTAESTLLIAGYFLGPRRLADLGLLRQMAAIGVSLAGSIPVAVSPHAAAAHAAGETDKVRSLYLATVRYSLVANVLWTLGLLLWGPTVISLLVGKEHFLGNAVLVPLALASFLELHAMTHALFVWNVGRWPFVPSVLGGGILNVIFASAGCAYYGFAGLAWGSMAAQAATVYWFHVVYALRQMGIALRLYFTDTILRTLLYAAAVALAGAAIRALASPAISSAADASSRVAGAVWGLSAILTTTLVASALAWIIMLTRGDRAYFLGLVGLNTR
jgi:O-antigen/teichoic acid export membrane protein